jgi:hypothetical protein
LRRFAAYLARFGLSRRRILNPDALAEYLAEQAMFASQKCSVEYLRLRAGVHWDALCRDETFRQGFEHGRRGAFVQVVGDVAEVCEIVLRGAGLAPAVIERLVPAAAAAALGRYPTTSHSAEIAEAAAEVRRRLAQRRIEPPRPLRRVGAGTAQRILALLPFDERLQAADLDYVHNNLCFALAQVHERMRGELDPQALEATVTGRPASNSP